MRRVGATTVRYRDLFGDREFTALFVADVVSRTGSYLGKFALAALVFERTRSAGLAAATFAVTYLPGILGGPVLSTLADRVPRKRLLVGCDLTRAGLMAAIAFVDMPIGGALALLLVVELVKVPFGSARQAILADVLPGERFPVGNALVGASQQAVQVVGLGLGGVVVVTLGMRGALIADMLSYVLSAVLVASLVAGRPAPARDQERPGLVRDTSEGLRVVRRTRSLPTLFWLLFLGPTVLGTAEGLALAYAHELGGGETLAGVFLAATPLGAVLGLAWVGKMPPRLRARVLIPFSLAVGGCVAVAGLVATPVVVIAAMFVAGVAMGHVAHLQAAIVGLVSSRVRGRIIGLANTILQIGQAGSILLTGFVAEVIGIREVFVCAGLTATAGVFLVALIGAPYAGKHRAEPHGRERVRPRPRPVVNPVPEPSRPVRGRTPQRPRRPAPATDPQATARGGRPRATAYADDTRYADRTRYPDRTRYADYTGHAEYIGRTARDRRSADDSRYDDRYDYPDRAVPGRTVPGRRDGRPPADGRRDPRERRRRPPDRFAL